MDHLLRTMRLLQLGDSTLPIGTFAFSSGLETAAATGAVHDAATLEAFVAVALDQSARSDAVVALHAHRAALGGDYPAVCAADRWLIASRAAAESRQMTLRMGRKLAELAAQIFPDTLTTRWAADIAARRTPGTHAATLAVAFVAAGLRDEETLFCALRYGTAAMLTGAALRCLRVTHFDTQRILARAATGAAEAYRAVAAYSLDDVQSFAPQMDILAAVHEQGASRLFMN